MQVGRQSLVFDVLFVVLILGLMGLVSLVAWGVGKL